LGSINLSKFKGIINGDWSEFINYVELSIETLDTIIDLNTFPIPEIEHATKLTRKIGSGIMGWADWLVMNGISYQSDEALQWINKIGDVYRNTARETSCRLHREWPGQDDFGLHNETLLTIAPTGTLSYLAGCSWGIEPIFDWEIIRTSESGAEKIVHPLRHLAVDNGLLNDVAHSISPEWQIKHQAWWQMWVDNAVSKTINLPAQATVDDIVDAIYLAHKLGCKGITVYRDSSKDKQPVKSSVGPSRVPLKMNSKETSHHVERWGSTLDFHTGCGRIHITCNTSERCGDRPYEVYILSDGGCPASNEALGKVISKYLHDPRLISDERQTVERIVKTLSKVDCPTAMRNPKSHGKSCAEIIAKRMSALWLQVPESGCGNERQEDKGISQDSSVKGVQEDGKEICPQCGSILNFGVGCRSGACVTCGWSGCL
jgi:ribonucleoside-diphosphate reductase alpha chain